MIRSEIVRRSSETISARSTSGTMKREPWRWSIFGVRLPMRVPPHADHSIEQIVDAERLFDSAWHIWQALCWLDYAKRKTSISAVQFAALELRQGIEHLWFEIIVTAVGGRLDIREYARCKGDSTKMYKVLDRLSPDHAKLVRFTNICGSIEINQPTTIEPDIPRLKRLHGEISQYLHFLGVPSETADSPKWFVDALALAETGANYIWRNATTARTGQLDISSMPPEVRDAWEQFRSGQIDDGAVRTRLHLAQPALRDRRRA